MSAKLKEKPYDLDQVSKLIALISDELELLTGELANVPFPTGAKPTITDLQAYQNIDFCSQKISDFSSILKFIAENHSCEAQMDICEIKKQTKLEFTHTLLNA